VRVIFFEVFVGIFANTPLIKTMLICKD